MDNQSWLADQCLQILGDKNKGTIQYLKSIAKKSSSLENLQSALNDFDIPINNNPRNKYFATELYQRFKQITQIEKAKITENKKKTQYKLLDMNLGQNKLFVKDQQVSNVKDAQMLRKQDIKERDELSRRIMQKDKLGKGKLTKNNQQGITLNEEEKMKLLPSLRQKSRMKFLDKRQKQKLQFLASKLKDQKELFDNQSLTLKQLKMRQIQQRVVTLAQANIKNQTNKSTYKHPQSNDNQLHQPKDKRMKVLTARYQDVPNQVPQDNLWDATQGKKIKTQYRTIDQIQKKSKKL